MKRRTEPSLAVTVAWIIVAVISLVVWAIVGLLLTGIVH